MEEFEGKLEAPDESQFVAVDVSYRQKGSPECCSNHLPSPAGVEVSGATDWRKDGLHVDWLDLG